MEELNGILSSVKKGQSVLQEQLDKYKKVAEDMPAVRAENKLLRRALLRKVSLLRPVGWGKVCVDGVCFMKGLESEEFGVRHLWSWKGLVLQDA